MRDYNKILSESTAVEILKDRIWKTLVESRALRIMHHHSETMATDTFRATLFVAPRKEEHAE